MAIFVATTMLALLLLASAASVANAARLLRQDPATYTSVKGQQPGGVVAMTGQVAEAIAAGGSMGIRYNEGRVVAAGDAYPGARSSDFSGNAAARTGVAADANVNLGIEVVAATSEGARAVAGSGVAMTADDASAVSSDKVIFRPGTSHHKGSTAFTDVAPQSAATVGMGNGPAAMAWANEAAAFARSGHNYVTGKMRKEFIDSSS